MSVEARSFQEDMLEAQDPRQERGEAEIRTE